MKRSGVVYNRYLQLCSILLEDGSVTTCLFTEHLLSSALAMHEDTVPNTRIVLARLLTKHVLTSCKYRYNCFIFVSAE